MSHVLLLLLLMAGHTKKTASDAQIHVKMRAQKVSVPYSGRFSMINEVNRGFMDDVSQHILSHVSPLRVLLEFGT